MSLVIATNKDEDLSFRQDQSIYSAFSFRNSLSSVYKIPPHSQVCLHSSKVNLDGRATITGSNSNYFDWYGEELTADNSQEESTSYPIQQSFGVGTEVLEINSGELADRITAQHREYYPNRMGFFECRVKRGAAQEFQGFEFESGYDTKQTNVELPDSFTPFGFSTKDEALEASRYTWTPNGLQGEFKRVDLGVGAATRNEDPVALGLGHPLSLSNGSMDVKFTNANQDSVEWSCGLSRDCPAPELWIQSGINDPDGGAYAPPWYNPLGFNQSQRDAQGPMNQYRFFCDFRAGRNALGELVVSHFVTDAQGDNYIEEVEYWTNTSSALAGAGRYDIDTNAEGGDGIYFTVAGEQVEVYLSKGVTMEHRLITKYVAGQPKQSYFKPVSQSCWCLHPVLFVGHNATKSLYTNSLQLSFSGMDIKGYDSRKLYKGGWFESMSLLQSTGSQIKGLADCQAVDNRGVPNSPFGSWEEYIPLGLNASKATDYVTGMIAAPAEKYVETQSAGVATLFGFRTSFVHEGTISQVGDIILTKLQSGYIPELSSTQSIFVRLNGFGNQVLNARTGNKSTILAHLPTAAVKEAGRFYYEPNRDVWLDLDNSYEIQTSDFGIDFVYSNEQYAKILQGQSIVVLYFRKDPTYKEID
jgi:hypothetical protein